VTRYIVPPAAAVLLCVAAGCATRTDSGTLENENRNLNGVVEQQQDRIDALTADKVKLDRRVREMEAKLAKMESTERVVEEAKEEISEQVRRVLGRFRGDTDVEVEQTPGGYRFVVREAVLFPTGETTLTVEGRGALQRIADVLRGGEERIVVEGHTDDVPVVKEETLKRFPRGNIELSTARALSVWEYLSKDGRISAKRMSVAGYGPHKPRAPNTTQLNRHQNRRVEILVESP